MVTAAALADPPTLGNYPDTSLPLSTNTTVTPDTAPTNTTSINVSTSTNFKGTLAGDATTGVVRVTDAHPAGTYVVTVRAFNAGGQTATKTFTLTVTTPPMCNPVNFAVATSFFSGAYPRSVVVGDFNGDGNQDLAVANDSIDDITIVLGDGAGNFSAATHFSSGGIGPQSLAVGDFNGDGKQDLAVVNFTSVDVSILLGDGAGNFSVATSIYGDINPYSVAVGDFNGDGKQDLAVAYGGNVLNPPRSVGILLGDGAGHLSAPTHFAVGNVPRCVVVGDFNGDGKQDLAVANYSSHNLSILLGDGAGHFGTIFFAAAGAYPISVVVGDFNGDGKQDLAVANSGSFTVSILLGDGAGHFSAATNFSAGTTPISVAVGDFNGDGKQDLAVANAGSTNVSILLGDGAGHFSTGTNFGADIPRSIAVGDFNGDGQQDLAVANSATGNLKILLRICAPTPARPRNLSTRLRVLTDDNVGVGGLIITPSTGSGPGGGKQVLLRGIGPSLANFNVPNPLADPVLELHGPTGFTTITNDNWMDAPNHQQIQDLGLAPTNNLESAILATLSPGNYTGILEGNNNGVGVALVEVWDVDQAAGSKLGNISTRGFVATDGDIMIGGLILEGNTAQDIVVRGIGPSLGMPNGLVNPMLELRDSSGTLIRANNDWMDDPAQAALIQAAGLAPANPLESAIYQTLAPGQYTSLLSGVNNGTGVGLVEVYDLQ